MLPKSFPGKFILKIKFPYQMFLRKLPSRSSSQDYFRQNYFLRIFGPENSSPVLFSNIFREVVLLVFFPGKVFRYNVPKMESIKEFNKESIWMMDGLIIFFWGGGCWEPVWWRAVSNILCLKWLPMGAYCFNTNTNTIFWRLLNQVNFTGVTAC